MYAPHQIYERHQRARDDAILLPPPANYKVANRIVESFKGAEKDFLAKKHESSDFLPPLRLDQPGINFSSYRHLPQKRRHPDSAHVEQMTAGRQIERRPTAPRNFTRSPGRPQRFCPLRRETSPGPYELPLRRYITARADRPFPTRRWPSPLLPSMPSNPTAQVITLQDIRRRRTVLLDFREVALDMLEETSTVLNQLDKTLSRLAALRKEASRCD